MAHPIIKRRTMGERSRYPFSVRTSSLGYFLMRARQGGAVITRKKETMGFIGFALTKLNIPAITRHKA